jgi:hypothetical protein
VRVGSPALRESRKDHAGRVEQARPAFRARLTHHAPPDPLPNPSPEGRGAQAAANTPPGRSQGVFDSAYCWYTPYQRTAAAA